MTFSRGFNNNLINCFYSLPPIAIGPSPDAADAAKPNELPSALHSIYALNGSIPVANAIANPV